MLTFLPLEQIDEMDKWEGSQLNKAKEILAFYELTKLVHGEEEAAKAQEGAKHYLQAALIPKICQPVNWVKKISQMEISTF